MFVVQKNTPLVTSVTCADVHWLCGLGTSLNRGMRTRPSWVTSPLEAWSGRRAYVDSIYDPLEAIKAGMSTIQQFSKLA